MTSTTTTGSTSTIYVGQLALDMYDSKNKDSGLARDCKQDPRSESKARQAGEESQESGSEAFEELSAKAGVGR